MTVSFHLAWLFLHNPQWLVYYFDHTYINFPSLKFNKSQCLQPLANFVNLVFIYEKSTVTQPIHTRGTIYANFKLFTNRETKLPHWTPAKNSIQIFQMFHQYQTP